MSRLRRRADNDAGMTLVEVIVALALVSIALFALLGELIVTARAQHQDKARTFALRLASDRIEKVRAMPYAAVSSTTETDIDPGNGYRYTISRAVSEVDAATLGTPTPGGGRVKQVTVIVRWTAQNGAASSVSLQTATADRSEIPITVSPTPGSTPTSPTPSASGSPAPAIVSFNATPTPLTTYADGTPASAIVLQAQLTGYSTGDTLTASWTDDVGGHTAPLTSISGDTWTVSLPTTGFRRVVSAGDDTATILFTLTTPSPTQTATTSLALRRYTAPSYSFVSVTSSVNPIPRKGGGGSNAGTNDIDVTFTATMVGVDSSAPATGVLGYLTPSGYKTVNLPHSTTDGQVFSYTFAKWSERFSPGTQTFTFSVSQGDTTLTRQITVAVS